ncbi:MAG: SprB repeat-containing protein [Bacteroidia bacterium]|nr:SprB repeat-containing protein [Bacteroidia bacterium]
MKIFTLASLIILQFFLSNAFASKLYNGSVQNFYFSTGYAANLSELSDGVANDIAAPISIQIGEIGHVGINGEQTGSIKINVTGGEAPYQFKIGNGNYQSSNKINNLAAGFYLVSVMDAKGNISRLPVIIYQPFQQTAENVSAN